MREFLKSKEMRVCFWDLMLLFSAFIIMWVFINHEIFYYFPPKLELLKDVSLLVYLFGGLVLFVFMKFVEYAIEHDE